VLWENEKQRNQFILFKVINILSFSKVSAKVSYQYFVNSREIICYRDNLTDAIGGPLVKQSTGWIDHPHCKV
jgi:hypothetical protein